MKKILIVDDEVHILELLKINFEAYGYLVELCGDSLEVLNRCLSFRPDIVLLDIMLPNITGIELCSLIRKADKLKNVGIIMVSAKEEIDDKVIALEIGADDYITKPFSIKELEARVCALLRRMDGRVKQSFIEQGSKFTYKDLMYAYPTKEVFKKGIKLDLTGKEIKLLEYLILNFGKIVSREMLMEKVWNIQEEENHNRSLDVYIRKLRIKLDEEESGISYIETVHGKGYKLG